MPAGWRDLSPSDLANLGRNRTLRIEPTPSKYKNRKTIADGITFDSLHEAEVWLTLKAREQAKQIYDLKHHTRWPLYAATTTQHIVAVAVATYESDFDYRNMSDGQLHVIDAKSTMTRTNKLYRLKRKLFEACYGIPLEEVL